MKFKYLVMLLVLACFNPVRAEVSLPEFNKFVKEFTDFINPYTSKVRASRKYSFVLINDRNFSAWFGDSIEISRGVLDSPHMTLDALALVACHEVGHDTLVAKKFLPNGIVFGWNHLLQDYFASYACLRPFLKQSKSYSDLILTRKQLDEIPHALQTKC